MKADSRYEPDWGVGVLVFAITTIFSHFFVPTPFADIGIGLFVGLVSLLYGRVVIGVGSGILIYLVFLFIFKKTINFSDPIIMRLITIFPFSFIYFKFVFPYVSCFVPPDRAWIMANRFKRESQEVRESFSGFRDINAQIEFQAGFRWKYPWDNLNISIDLTKKVKIENDPERVFTLADKNQLILKWRRFFMPLPGNCVNYIKSRPDVTERKLLDDTNRYIQGYIGEKTKVSFGQSEQENFKRAFEKDHKEPSYIDDVERNYGIWTDTPEIVDMDQPRSQQEIRNILQTTIDMVRESKGALTADDARGIILAYKAQGADIDYIEFAKRKAAK